jgi:hypothetical protein
LNLDDNEINEKNNIIVKDNVDQDEKEEINDINSK